jgi:hypothetical protein
LDFVMRIYQPSDHALVNQLDDTAIALNLQTGDYYSLNEVGARVWALLVESGDSAVVAEALAAEYAVSVDEALVDVEELIEGLEAGGLLVRSEKSQPV